MTGSGADSAFEAPIAPPQIIRVDRVTNSRREMTEGLSTSAMPGYSAPTMLKTHAPGLADSPALSAEDALKTFYMSPGYHVELVASEPLIQEPVAIDWDLDGRLWAVEMPGFMAARGGSPVMDATLSGLRGAESIVLER